MPARRFVYCLSLLCGLPLAGQAIELYRYVDNNGITVISRQGVPSNVIGNGYEVLNEQGRVVRVVPRALTAEEHRQLQEAKRQAELDRQLMRLYSHVEDVDRAAARKQAELDALTGLVRRNINDLQEERSQLLNEAANQERAGRSINNQLRKQIEALNQQEYRYLQDIANYQQQKDEFAASFATDRARVAELLQAEQGTKN